MGFLDYEEYLCGLFFSFRHLEKVTIAVGILYPEGTPNQIFKRPMTLKHGPASYDLSFVTSFLENGWNMRSLRPLDLNESLEAVEAYTNLGIPLVDMGRL